MIANTPSSFYTRILPCHLFDGVFGVIYNTAHNGTFHSVTALFGYSESCQCSEGMSLSCLLQY
ncbi:hypothetical protein SAMN04488146_101325 [Bacillus nitratireducens]|nr:hypothetical protein SAMN04488146_101325 [Bacillus nitratireducens]